jgi:hypothetical protein
MRRGKKIPAAGTRRKVRILQSYDGMFRCKAFFASKGLREYVIGHDPEGWRGLRECEGRPEGAVDSR